MVRGEDLGDRGDAFAGIVADVGVDREVEVGGAPEGAPPLGEDGCPKGRLDGKEGDDYEQHLVGEAADEVEVEARRRLFRIWLDTPFDFGCLGLHLSMR